MNCVSPNLIKTVRCILEGKELARNIVDILEDKKGENILLLDIKDIAPFTDYFVICTGTSERMLQALVDEVQEKVDKSPSYPRRLEGIPADGWIVLDLGDVVLHLFSPERRDYYRLEELWSEGKVVLHLQ
ncbi:MAG: ribosome silencing factor [Chloroflexota bacterium]